MNTNWRHVHFYIIFTAICVCLEYKEQLIMSTQRQIPNEGFTIIINHALQSIGLFDHALKQHKA